jgi:four helix bundle protein
MRGSGKEYERFLGIALGSAGEVRYLLGLVVDLGLVSAADATVCKECSDHVVRALLNLHRAAGRFEG